MLFLWQNTAYFKSCVRLAHIPLAKANPVGGQAQNKKAEHYTLLTMGPKQVTGPSLASEGLRSIFLPGNWELGEEVNIW